MTGGEIETLLKERVQALAPPISGNVYYKDMRPRQMAGGSNRREDCEVSVLTARGSQVVEGSCIVNIYVPDTITASGLNMKTKQRCDDLEKWMESLPELLRDGVGVYFWRDGLILSVPEPDTKEHFVSLKMKFKVIQEHY